MKPLKHTGDSANIAWYAEGQDQQDAYIYAEVLCDSVQRRAGGLAPRLIPEFHIRVTRVGEGRIAEFTYRPRRPRPDPAQRESSDQADTKPIPASQSRKTQRGQQQRPQLRLHRRRRHRAQRLKETIMDWKERKADPRWQRAECCSTQQSCPWPAGVTLTQRTTSGTRCARRH